MRRREKVADQATPYVLKNCKYTYSPMFIPSKTIAHVKKKKNHCHLLRNLGGFDVATYCTILLILLSMILQTILAKCEYVTIRLLFWKKPNDVLSVSFFALL